jgi:hypothetical protein
VSTRTALSQDAATVVGLAGTALAFAGSADEEAERWLCTLRLYGESGVLLQALGVGEEPRDARGVGPGVGVAPTGETAPPNCEARMASVLTCAEQFARQRDVRALGTIEVLLAVMQVYGASFDWALERRGTDRLELLERVTGANLHRSEKPAPAPARS